MFTVVKEPESSCMAHYDAMVAVAGCAGSEKLLLRWRVRWGEPLRCEPASWAKEFRRRVTSSGVLMMPRRVGG